MQRYKQTDYCMGLSLVDDPFPYFEHLRRRGTVVQLPVDNVVAVTGFEEALVVSLDSEHFSAVNAVLGPLPPIPSLPDGEDITAQIEAHRPQILFGEDALTLD